MSTSRMISIACLQMSSGYEVKANLEWIEKTLESATKPDVLVLPENFAQMPRYRQDQYVEDASGGQVQQFLSRLSKQLNCFIVGGSLAVREASALKPFARCLVYSPTGEQIGQYDKLHLFDVSVESEAGQSQAYRESDQYQRGGLVDEQLSPLKLLVGEQTLQLGLTICYDLRFPRLYQRLAENGAELIVVPSAFTAQTGEVHWRTLLRARAIENQLFVAAPAQVGKHANGRCTWGHSMIISPWGDVIAEQTDKPGLLMTEIDLAKVERVRQRFPTVDHHRLPI